MSNNCCVHRIRQCLLSNNYNHNNHNANVDNYTGCQYNIKCPYQIIGTFNGKKYCLDHLDQVLLGNVSNMLNSPRVRLIA